MPNAVEDTLAKAKDELAKANNLTTSVEGTPTSHFAPKATPSHIPSVKSASSHEFSKAPYSMAQELNAKKSNIDEYKAATE